MNIDIGLKLLIIYFIVINFLSIEIMCKVAQRNGNFGTKTRKNNN